MTHLLFRHGNFYFNRRVPRRLREFDRRGFIRLSLRTDSRKEALRLAALENARLETYWLGLVSAGRTHAHCAYQGAVDRAKLFGFTYMTNDELAAAPVQEIQDRLLHVEKESLNPHHVEAVLGGVKPPSARLQDVPSLYWDFCKEKILSKSPNQLRKWKRPRERAVNNLVGVVGNKIITEVNRGDLVKFKNWWLEKIHRENLGANSANKNFIQLKVMLDTINDNLLLKLNIEALFKKILLKETEESERRPFSTEHIREKLLNPENLTGLNDEAKWILYAIAETGAGISEQLGLLPEDIILNHAVPHIVIKPRHQANLKTKYRKRIIPLVGFALDAFNAYPQGFTHYKDRPDALSSVLGKYLRENHLLPSENHSVYSLRHSFQDRLLAVNAPDRVQADLMGHKFSRQAYGEGSSLTQKLQWMQKVQIKSE